jgi:adenylate kinase family enzyme
MKKIVIVGNVSSGKTTMANKLGKMLDIPVHHLDKIFWTVDGHLKQDVFIAQQEEMMKGDRWIIDGNFMRSKSYDLRLQNADTIIYFDFNLGSIYWRLLKRGIKHFNKLRPDMGGNKRWHLDWSLIKFIWNYPAAEERARILQYANSKKLIVLHNPKEEKDFLKDVMRNMGQQNVI